MTGISVGDYRDPAAGLDLGELMRAAARVDGVERVRLSSVEVIHVRESLIDALADEPKVCPHLHVPLQSGDDQVLASMGRSYDSAGTSRRSSGSASGSRSERHHRRDRGFPTEDEAALERTLRSCERPASPRFTRSASRRAPVPWRSLGDPVPGGEEAAQLRAARPLRGARAPASCRKLGRRGGPGRQGGRLAVLGLQPRLHAQLPPQPGATPLAHS